MMTPARPKASIIISCFNYAQWLPQAVQSARDQTYPNTEVIVVDDGSTDGSSEVICRFGQAITGVFKSNGGMASAWNAGFARSSGDAVLFLDADDVLAPTAIERAMPCLSDRSVVKVHWPVALTDAAGRVTGGVIPRRDLPHGSMTDVVLADGPEAIAGTPIHGNLWSRHFLDRVFPVPESEFRQHSDMYLMTLAPLYGPMMRLAAPLSFYRVHGDNDYASTSAAEKNRRNLGLYRRRCALQAEAARTLHLDASRDAWLSGNPHYEWMAHFDRAAAQLMAAVPEEREIVLIDDGQCADGITNWVFERRPTRRLMERDDQYDGPPPDDDAAIAALERLRTGGVGFLAVMWCSFWWLDHYRRLFAHLERTARIVVRSDDVTVYAL